MGWWIPSGAKRAELHGGDRAGGALEYCRWNQTIELAFTAVRRDMDHAPVPNEFLTAA